MKVNVQELCGRFLAPASVDAYSRSWAKYVEFAGSEEAALMPSTIFAWRSHLVDNTQYARSTINGHLMNIVGLSTWLMNAGILDQETRDAFHKIRYLRKNALPGRGKLVKPIRIEPSEMRAICDTPQVNPDEPLEAFKRALVTVLASSGMRISELAKLKLSDITVAGNNQYIIRDYVGKGARKRDIPLSAEAYQAIQDWVFQRPVSSEYVFNGFAISEDGQLLWADKHAHRAYLGKCVKQVAEKAGIPGIKPHDFRRFVGTQLARRDIRLAQKVLGHSSVEITAQYYVLDVLPAGTTDNLF